MNELVPVVITADTIERELQLGALIDELRTAYVGGERASCEVPLRTTVRDSAPTRSYGVMPAVSRSRELFVTKLATLLPERTDGAPTMHAVSVAMSTHTGRVEAVVDGAAITNARCAATAGLVAEACTKDAPLRVAVVGSGILARQQVRGIAAVRHIAALTVTSRRREHASAFVTRVAPTLPKGCVTAIGDDAERLAAEHDIVCTATASPVPIITTLPDHRTVHVCCMGAHAEDRREVDHTVLARTVTICEDIGLAVAEAGDVHAGALDIGAMLRTDRSTLRRTSTVFSSTGDPFADLVTVAHILDRMRARATAVA